MTKDEIHEVKDERASKKRQLRWKEEKEVKGKPNQSNSAIRKKYKENEKSSNDGGFREGRKRK